MWRVHAYSHLLIKNDIKTYLSKTGLAEHAHLLSPTPCLTFTLLHIFIVEKVLKTHWWATLLHHEHGQCSLFWTNPTYKIILPSLWIKVYNSDLFLKNHVFRRTQWAWSWEQGWGSWKKIERWTNTLLVLGFLWDVLTITKNIELSLKG